MIEKEELKKYVGESYIRCLTKEEFGKILEMFESKLSIDEWDKFDTYTVYNDVYDEVEKSVKGYVEILANDVIKEFENNWLIKDGEKISQKIEEKSLKQSFKNILEKNSKKDIEKMTKESLERIDDFIKDSFEKTKEKHTLEKLGDNQKVTKKELEHEFGKVGLREVSQERIDILGKIGTWDKQEELLTDMKNYNDGENECIKKMYEVYPNLLNEFKTIQRQQLELFCKKMLDYGISNISAGTLLSNDEEINFALSGLWFRINDKIQRFKNLLFFKKGNEVEESLQDTFLDISNYGIILKLVKDGNWKK